MTSSRHQPGAPDYLLALVETELSFPSRLARGTLALVLAMMAGAIALRAVTEPALPSRARVAFAVIGGLGVFSSVYGLRMLTSRGALLAWHRVIAARIAVGLAAMVVLGGSIIGYLTGILAAFVIAGFGLVLLLGTIALLRQENRKFAALTARRHALAQQLNIKEAS